MEKGGYICILTNTHRNVLYTGVTSDLDTRIHQHKTHFYKDSFTAKYNVEFLVFYEAYGRIEDAIDREKKVKKFSRAKKIALIEAVNPKWDDLWEQIS